jgi:predicted O-linked N-acetylglucosamine transferase (SPINDLY family)
MGDSILSAAGLADFVCRGEDEFVAKCVAVAADLPALASLRDGLRPRLLASPLADAVRSTRDLENAYRGMWRSWCMRK